MRLRRLGGAAVPSARGAATRRPRTTRRRPAAVRGDEPDGERAVAQHDGDRHRAAAVPPERRRPVSAIDARRGQRAWRARRPSRAPHPTTTAPRRARSTADRRRADAPAADDRQPDAGEHARRPWTAKYHDRAARARERWRVGRSATSSRRRAARRLPTTTRDARARRARPSGDGGDERRAPPPGPARASSASAGQPVGQDHPERVADRRLLVPRRACARSPSPSSTHVPSASSCRTAVPDRDERDDARADPADDLGARRSRSSVCLSVAPAGSPG